MNYAILTLLITVTIHEGLSEGNESCGPPPNIEGANISNLDGNDHPEGKVISYSCNFGYLTEGSGSTAECKASSNGQELEWSEPDITCVPKSCGFPGLVLHANRVGSRFTYPNQVSYECEEGYTLVGRKQRFCQASGEWSGRLPSCKTITCSQPESPLHGRVVFSSLEFGSELRYECESGYLLSSREARFCLANETWSGEDPRCVEGHCDVPQPPEFGKMELVGNKAMVGSILIFSCEEDRILLGSRTSRCLGTGQWTFPAPTCAEPCNVAFVQNGEIGVLTRNRYRRIIYRKLPVGELVENNRELTLKCDRNFQAAETAGASEVKVKCFNGQWSQELRCEPVSCRSSPPPVPNARVSKVSSHHGGNVVYQCEDHFKKVKYGDVRCDFGRWTGPTPVCKDTRCYTELLNLPGVTKDPEIRHYSSGRGFLPVCAGGYEYSSREVREILCSEGEWVVNAPPCKAAKCTEPPPSIQHGFPTAFNFDHNSYVRYECDHLYLLEEAGSVQCQFGKWRGSLPKCKDSRCYHEDIKHNRGVILIPNLITYNGKLASIECEEDFELKYASPKCENGVWIEQSISPCSRKGCLIPKINHGMITIRQIAPQAWNWERFRFESKITYTPATIGSLHNNKTQYFVSCDPGFYFHAIPSANHVTSKCERGQWNPEPACLRPNAVFRPRKTSSGNSGEKPVSKNKAVKDKNPELEITTTPPTTTSIEDSTTEELITEILITEEPASEELSTMPNVNDSCTCTYNVEDSNLQAYAGQKLLSFGSKVQNGDLVKLYCTRYKYAHLQGSSEVKCSDCRAWHSSEFPTCIDPVEGDVIISWLQKENTLFVTPNGELSAVPESNLTIMCTVLNSTNYALWDVPITANVSVAYSAIEVNGRYILVSSINIVHADYTHEGIYECRGGSRSPRRFYLTVPSNEVAVPDAIEYCNPIEIDDSVVVQYEDQMKMINSKANFRCINPHHQLEGNASIICLPSGFWSERSPICKEIQCRPLKGQENQRITYSDRGKVGSKAMFHCLSPFLRKGPSQVTCLPSGNWSGPSSPCTSPDCIVENLFENIPEGVVPNVDDIHNETMPYGSVVRLTCDSNSLRLIGGKTVRCESGGIWDVERVQCVLGCAPVEKPGDSSLIVDPTKEFYRFGEFSMFSCPPDHQLTSEVERVMCLRSGWSEDIPDCIKL